MIKRFDQMLEKVCIYGAVICVGLMLSLSLLNITLRYFEHSLLWLEPLVRHLVFLAAFLGGAIATGKNEHIRIDIAAKLLQRSKSTILEKILDKIVIIACVVATGLFIKGGYDLFLVEQEFGKLSFFQIHSSYLIAIIPVGMGFICLRFLLSLFIEKEKKE